MSRITPPKKFGARDKSQDTGDKDTQDHHIFFESTTSHKTKTTPPKQSVLETYARVLL